MENSPVVDPSRENADVASAISIQQSFSTSEFARMTQLPAGDEHVCVLEAEELPPPLVLLHYASTHGGVACGGGSKPLLFYPSQNGQCPRRLNISGQISKKRIEKATEEFRSCLNSSTTTIIRNRSLTIRSNELNDHSDLRFSQFMMDAMAMIIYDALPVQNTSSFGVEAICFEGQDLNDVLNRITEADIVEDGVAEYVFNDASCEQVIDDFVRSAAR